MRCPPVSDKCGPSCCVWRPFRPFGRLRLWRVAKCFFYARVPSGHQQPACRTANPSPWGCSEPLMGAIRQELRSHSLIMWTGLDLHPPPRIHVTNPVQCKNGRTFFQPDYCPTCKRKLFRLGIRVYKNQPKKYRNIPQSTTRRQMLRTGRRVMEEQ